MSKVPFSLAAAGIALPSVLRLRDAEIASEDRKSVQQNGADAGDSRCLRIRCRLEWMPPAAEAQVVADTLAVLPRTCPFVDIVPATLYYFGYNAADVIGATGTKCTVLTLTSTLMRIKCRQVIISINDGRVSA